VAVSVETAEETQKQIEALGDNWEKQLVTERGLRKIQKNSFEGALANPTQANALYLNVGSSSSDYIDADIYSNLSLAGRSSVKTAIELHWVDSHNNTGSVAIGDTLRGVGGDTREIQTFIIDTPCYDHTSVYHPILRSRSAGETLGEAILFSRGKRLLLLRCRTNRR